MSIDFLAGEPHFIDHLVPIWRALPPSQRGTFIVHPAYVRLMQSMGITASVERGPGGPIFVASWGDVQGAQRMGRTRIARIEHGAGQSYGGDPASEAATSPSYPGGRGQERVSLFLVPNTHSADRWQRAYPSASVVIVGCPKLDQPPEYRPDIEPAIAVSTHFDCRVVPETRSAWYFYRQAVVALARERRVLAHSHPRIATEVRSFYRRNGVEYTDSFTEVQRRAAVYVCDNSSSLFEFAAMGRPVVVLDLPMGAAYGTTGASSGYRKHVHHGLRFWDAADVGVRIDDPKLLPAAVNRALADPPEVKESRERALDIVYAYRDGMAADRAATALMEWAGQASSPPLRWERVA